MVSELDKVAWTQLGYVNQFDKFRLVEDNIERIDVNQVSPQEFIEKFEKPYKPVVIRGIEDSWKARQKWTLDVSYRISIYINI